MADDGKAQGFETYRKNLGLYQLHMRGAAKRSIKTRTKLIERGADLQVGVDSGRLRASGKIRFLDGGMKGEFTSGWPGSYAPHHHFPGVTRHWSGNAYVRDPFDRHAPGLITDLRTAHRTFRPLPTS